MSEVYIGKDKVEAVAAALQGAGLSAHNMLGLPMVIPVTDYCAIKNTVTMLEAMGFSIDATLSEFGVDVEAYSDHHTSLFQPPPRKKVGLWRRLLRRLGL